MCVVETIRDGYKNGVIYLGSSGVWTFFPLFLLPFSWSTAFTDQKDLLIVGCAEGKRVLITSEGRLYLKPAVVASFLALSLLSALGIFFFFHPPSLTCGFQSRALHIISSVNLDLKLIKISLQFGMRIIQRVKVWVQFCSDFFERVVIQFKSVCGWRSFLWSSWNIPHSLSQYFR